MKPPTHASSAKDNEMQKLSAVYQTDSLEARSQDWLKTYQWLARSESLLADGLLCIILEFTLDSKWHVAKWRA